MPSKVLKTQKTFGTGKSQELTSYDDEPKGQICVALQSLQTFPNLYMLYFYLYIW